MPASRTLRSSGHTRMLPRVGAVIALSVLVAMPLAVDAQSPSVPATSAVGTIVFQRADGDGAPAKLFVMASDGTGLRSMAPQMDCCPVMSPDGSRVMFAMHPADGQGITTGIIGVDGTGYDALPLPDKTLYLGPGAWIDDDTIAFQGWDDSDPSRNGTYVANPADMSSLRRLTTGDDLALAASPDGTRLLFVSTVAGNKNGDLDVIGTDGTHRVQLNPAGTFVGGEGATASWSPDGRRVAFAASQDGGSLPKVYVVDADGANLVPIFHSGGPIEAAQWSPDGQAIAFESTVADQTIQVLTAHPDGTGLTQVTSSLHGSRSWLPRWSPDGSKLLFVTFIDGPDQADLWTADANGSNPTQVTHDPGAYESYAWAP